MSAWKPEGYSSVSPYLMCADPEGLIAFLVAVFGAGQVRRFDRPDGSLMHAEMRIDDSIVMVGGGATQYLSSGCTSTSMCPMRRQSTNARWCRVRRLSSRRCENQPMMICAAGSRILPGIYGGWRRSNAP